MGGVLIQMCVLCIPKAPLIKCTHLGGARLYFVVSGIRLFSCHSFVQISCCHQSTKRGEIVRACLSLSSFGDWWQCFCGLIVCVEYFRDSFFGTRRFFPLGALSEDGVVYFVSVLVDLSRRRHRTIKRGYALERLGWNQHVHFIFAPQLLSSPWSLPFRQKWRLWGASGSTAARVVVPPMVLKR